MYIHTDYTHLHGSPTFVCFELLSICHFKMLILVVPYFCQAYTAGVEIFCISGLSLRLNCLE